MNTLHKTTCLLGVTLLALTACGPEEEDSAQEGVDPSGAEDQGDTPGEIADEDGEEPDPEEDEGAEAGDAPDLADIEDQLWENSTSADSVTITSEIPAELMNMSEPATEEGDEESPEAQDDEDNDAEEEDSDTLEVVVGGEMEGEGSVWQLEDLIDYAIYGGGETVYQTVESFVAEYQEFQPDEAAGPDSDELLTALQEEGAWIDISGTVGGQIETPRQFIEDFRDSMLAEAGVDSLAETGISGETDTRDGEDVWVYREDSGDEFIEFVVIADEDEPLLAEINTDAEGTEMYIAFSDWNESEIAPDEPDEDEVIGEEELDAIGQSLM